MYSRKQHQTIHLNDDDEQPSTTRQCCIIFMCFSGLTPNLLRTIAVLIENRNFGYDIFRVRVNVRRIIKDRTVKVAIFATKVKENFTEIQNNRKKPIGD